MQSIPAAVADFNRRPRPGRRRRRPLAGVDLPERLGTYDKLGSAGDQGGVVFLGGGGLYLYAFDKATGAEPCRDATPLIGLVHDGHVRSSAARPAAGGGGGSGPPARVTAGKPLNGGVLDIGSGERGH